MLNRKQIQIMAKDAIPIAEIEIREGPYISPPPGKTLQEGDIQIFWYVKVLDYRMEWQSGIVQTIITKEARSNERFIELDMQMVKECYARFRDKLSHIEGFQKNYRTMMGIIYSDKFKFEQFELQKAY